MPPPLSAVDNPLVKRLVQLHEPRHRRESGAFLVEGRRAIAGFLTAGWTPELILLREGETLPEGWPEARFMSPRVADKLSLASSPAGFLAVFPEPPPPTMDAQAGGLVLVGLADPGNLGTLVRSAAAFGCDQVLCAGGADPYAPKAVQASAGTLAALRLRRSDDAEARALLAGGAPRCALVVSGGSRPDELPQGNRWLVVGSEAHGLPPAWLDRKSVV